MSDRFGFSVNLTSFDTQKAMLLHRAGSGVPLFLSLHVSEDFGPNYVATVEAVCRSLNQAGYRLIADVSVKTQLQFSEPDLFRLASRLGLSALRIDYGISQEDLLHLAGQIPLVLNASNIPLNEAEALAAVARKAGLTLSAMHNFYPRPETGLDEAFFSKRTAQLQALGIKVSAFIAGDEEKRGPLFKGLPTLEKHRSAKALIATVELFESFGIDAIYVADPGLSLTQYEMIRAYLDEGVVTLPTVVTSCYESLYDRIFTCRADSPAGLIRFQESREYSCFGTSVEAEHCVARPIGSLTMDNLNYLRYSGEIQITRNDYPENPAINVIGSVDPDYHALLPLIQGGRRFRLCPPI